jgi:hypothetical protein
MVIRGTDVEKLRWGYTVPIILRLSTTPDRVLISSRNQVPFRGA